MIRGDWQTAARELQAQHNATLMGKWAHESEKLKGKLDRIAKNVPATATVVGRVVLRQVPASAGLAGVGLVIAGVALHRGER